MHLALVHDVYISTYGFWFNLKFSTIYIFKFQKFWMLDISCESSASSHIVVILQRHYWFRQLKRCKSKHTMSPILGKIRITECLLYLQCRLF